MKNVLSFLSFTVILFLFGCTANKKLHENRILLKEYAYCKCIEYTTKDTSLFENDISISVYIEISNYYREVFGKLDTLAKKASFEIKPSEIADHEGRKAVFLNCFMFYNSKKLDSLIRTLDNQFYKGW